MPHIIVEYTDNLAADGEIRRLLEKLAAKMANSDGVFPIGGVRVRAVRLSEYVIADGKDDYAFANVTAKIGSGRSPDFKQKFFGEMFEIVKQHFKALLSERLVALSLYVEEIDEKGAFRENNIHLRFKSVSRAPT
jgi:5-carboxymethyl-2-hydroxymuconate isomerase